MKKKLAIVLVLSMCIGIMGSCARIDDIAEVSAIVSEIYNGVLEHNYVIQSSNDATCTKAGSIVHTCEKCGNSYTETIPPKGHTPGDWKITLEATDTTNGMREQYCVICGEVLAREVIRNVDNEKKPLTHITSIEAGEDDISGGEGSSTPNTSSTSVGSQAPSNQWNATPGGITGNGGTLPQENYAPVEHDHKYTEKVTKEATCTEAGTKTFTCDCGSFYTVQIPVIDHAVTTTTEKGDCTHDTIEKTVCSTCGAVFTSKVVKKATGHDYGEVIVQLEATCEAPGKATHTCNVCGYGEDMIIPATGHHFDEFVERKDATCTEAGYEVYRCVCGKTENRNAIPAVGHVEGDWVETVEATCTTNGTEELYCSVCHAKISERTILAKNHSYTESGRKEATCDEDGYVQYTCATCGNTYTDTIAKTGHKWVLSEHKDPTCTQTGYDKYTCANKDCAETRTDELATTEHHYTMTSRKAPTCTAEGVEYWKCDNCDSSYTVPVDMAAHAYAKTDHKDATCTEDGYDRYTCSACGASYDETIESTGHEYVLAGDNGHNKTYSCNKCGDTYSETYSAEHHYQEISRVPATCTSEGSVTYSCSDCGEQYSETLPMVAHQTVVEITAQPSCTAEGTKIEKCKVCGETFSTESIPALGHKEETKVTIPATCSAVGKETTSCSVCGAEISTRELEKLPHTVVEETTIEPTCGKNGEKVKKCSVCGEILETSSIDMLTHQYDETAVVEAKCGVDGSRTYTCRNCGDSYTEKIPALTHHYLLTQKTDATCSAKGVERYECEYCHDVQTKESEQLSHRFKTEVTAGTCKTKETTKYTCELCGYNYTEETGDFGDHLFVQTKYEAATCEKEGVREETCQYCGEKNTETLTHTGHNYQLTDDSKPTCTGHGSKTFTCENCGDSYKEDVEPLGHTPGEWEIVEEPHDTTDGLRVKRCQVCGEIVKRDVIEYETLQDQEYTIQFADGTTQTIYGHIDTEFSNQLVAQLNEYRKSLGLEALTVSPELTSAAQIRASEISVKWGHERPDGTMCFTASDMINGENIARNYSTPEQTMTGWKNSPGHDSNMRGDYKSVGIACFVYRYEPIEGIYSYYRFSVQEFSRS